MRKLLMTNSAWSKVIQGRDFTCMAESVNAVEACLRGRRSASVYATPGSRFQPSILHMILLLRFGLAPAQDEHTSRQLFLRKPRGDAAFIFAA